MTIAIYLYKVVITKNPIILSSLLQSPFFDLKCAKCSIVIVFTFWIFRSDEWPNSVSNCVSTHEMENRFRITFALEKPKYTRLQMDF